MEVLGKTKCAKEKCCLNPLPRSRARLVGEGVGRYVGETHTGDTHFPIKC